jgi:O-antigen ligase
MMCNYLTVSFGLVLVARQCGWLGIRTFILLLAGIVVAAITSLSPGLGGIALLAGLWVWLVERHRNSRIALLALCCGTVVAALFVIALTVTPVVYATAPFLIHVPGSDFVLAPSGRFLTWTSAAREFAHHFPIGHGIGIEPAQVVYPRPDGFVEHLTDAHNLFLSIAAQAGIVGLAGLAALIGLAVRLTGRLELDGTCSKALMVGLGLSFLNGFVYQGLGGAFEHSRHLWVLLGMLIAASALRPEVSHQGGNNRTPAAPSPC